MDAEKPHYGLVISKLLKFLIPFILAFIVIFGLFKNYGLNTLHIIQSRLQEKPFIYEEWGENAFSYATDRDVDPYRKVICVNEVDKKGKCEQLHFHHAIAGSDFLNTHGHAPMDKVVEKWNRKIPRIIHTFTTESNTYSSQFTEFEVDIRYRHPDWDYVKWSEEDLERLISKNFPSFVHSWKMFNRPARAQWATLIGLYEYGGLWISRSFQILKNFDHALQVAERSASLNSKHYFNPYMMEYHPLFLASKPLKYDFFMASPRHPFVLSLIKELYESNVPESLMNRRPLRGYSEFSDFMTLNATKMYNETFTIKEFYLKEKKVHVMLNPHIISLPDYAFATSWSHHSDAESSDICFLDSVMFDPQSCVDNALNLKGNEWGILWLPVYDLLGM
ncbi:galactose residue biosynthesis protein Pvg2 [Schizosaccharomyces cryophilus OY26]|uniref:Galactose residue biosynthesis protein Pvg2 n=1 Tax=Schizosaccharomyces cryophilus (strain OY26 / ATCC MYA-4695 / CBS 11777 / NBRC 106824 / NRRL Y48691) TaxID=653667 RepID=S9X2Z9_SCHCR|nr:galactose residue biosynthesis protein Pvg2 [Schizosaccharomyces cryophilus OY26]EPY51477.1 galactose residue biosynthesis protein Pvg2 [Schizosaccharomyces cryophilus OY26]